MGFVLVRVASIAKQHGIWRLIHSWTSLLCTVFILVLCLTGLPLIFSDELEDVLGYSLSAPHRSIAGEQPVSLDKVIASAQARYPSQYIQFLAWDDADKNVIKLGMAPVVSARPAEVHWLAIDARTAEVFAEPKPERRAVLAFLLDLHRGLLLGLPGELFLGMMGVLLVGSLISGLVLYGPAMRKLPFGTYRRQRSARVRLFDLHNLLGIVTFAWFVLVAMTGIVNTMAAPMFSYWLGNAVPRWVRASGGGQTPDVLQSAQEAVEGVLKKRPGQIPTVVVFPYARSSSGGHYLVWTKGASPLTSKLLVPSLVDVRTGAIDASLSIPWYLTVLQISRPLHFGDYGGLPMKVLWAALDIVVVVVLGTGVALWFKKRGLREGRSGNAYEC